MSTIIEEIKTASKEVQTTSRKSHLTFEQQADSFLDFILERKKEIDYVSNLIGNLNNRLQSEIDSSQETALEIRKDLGKLVNTCQHLVAMIRNSKLYTAIKESADNLLYEVRSLNETLLDIDLRYIKLPVNNEMNEIVVKIKASR